MTPPERFGRYELLEHIATGGMAEIFLARATGEAGFRRRLVIKRIREELADDPRFVSMFIKEGQIGAHLSHPNIVHVHELGRAGSSYYIAMEYLQGKDLTRLTRALRAQGQALPADVAVAIIAEACRGLAYAHSVVDADGTPLGIVHRDVSPHNLIVTLAGEVKLVDFGIARLMATASASASKAATGRPGGGKYAYMSPEQALGEPVDHRSDLFCVGIVLWELLVGRRLYTHPDPAEKLRRVRAAQVPDPGELDVVVDPALWDILRRTLSRNPSDRQPSAGALEEDLRVWLFESRSRVGRAQIAQMVRKGFPELARPRSTDQPLERLVRDLSRLGQPESQTPTPSDADCTSPLSPPSSARKPVVVAMIDVDGLTDLSDRLDPEDLARVNFRLLRWIRRIVDRYGGVLARAVDDHMTLIFGTYRTRADDVDRALACACALFKALPDLERAGGPKIQLAIGVHAGDMTVRTQHRRVRYAARGDTTRLARRLSAIADHGEILVSEPLLRRASVRFRLRRGPRLDGRGGRPPTATFRLEGRRRGALPGERGTWLTRGDELDTLRSALVRLADGRGGALTPCGEVGIGKSRLLREIRALADRSDIPCFVARCDGVSSDRPYEPFRDLVLSMLGVDPGAPAATAADQSSRLTSVGLTPREVEAVGALLGSASKNPPGPQEIRDALQRLCLSMARSGPFILCLDDVHNLAPTDRELLDRLLAGLRKAPILFLLTWDGAPSSKAPGQLVRLAALTAENQSRLTCDLLLCTQIGERLGSLIRETCEGNPLYVEEMVAFLTERGSLRVEGGEATLVADSTEPLPPGLAALVAARIDALAPAAKGALQLAAVIGARFDAQILAEAAGVDDTTLLCLDLEAHGLIARASETQWAFSSHLVQQAALRGALGVQRRDYHRMVAQAIERCFPQDLAPWREDLLVHCAEGGRPVDAARYAFAAGQELEREQFLEQARAVYRRGVTTLRAADSDTSTYDARVQGEAMLTSRIGVVSHVLGDTADGDRSLRLALDIASDVGLPWIEVRAHVELGKSYAQRGSAARANAHLSQALALLEHAPDPAIEVEILEAQAELAFDSGRNAQAESLWELALARAADDPAAEARCQLGLGNRFIRSGDHDRAGPLLEAALVASLEAGDRILEGRVLNNIGLVHSYAGRTDRALEYYRRALTVRAGIGYVRGVAINHHNIGDTHFHAGQWPQAWVAFSRSRELACEMAWDRGVVLNDVYLAYLSASQSGGGADDVLEATDRALALGDHEIASTGAWLAGRLLLERGDRTAAHDQLHQALSLAKDWGLTPMIRDLEQLLSAPAPAPP